MPRARGHSIAAHSVAHARVWDARRTQRVVVFEVNAHAARARKTSQTQMTQFIDQHLILRVCVRA